MAWATSGAPHVVTPDDNAQLGFELPEGESHWPPHARFPYNFDGVSVGQQIKADLMESANPLVITGYASIEELLDFLSSRARRETQEPSSLVRLLIGVEPTRPQKGYRGLPGTDLQQEVLDYWLDRGISLLHCREVLDSIALLKRGGLEVRLSDSSRVHAKIYATEEAVTIGSSNFTDPGLRRNLEGNARFLSASEPVRHAEALGLAEGFWSLGKDYTEGFAELLESLLQKVSWREALSRACAELLEGEWGRRMLDSRADGPGLWPSQEAGITQALWVLENVGSVLVADATGSGKTKLGAQLLRALQERNTKIGRRRIQLPVVVCPPPLKTQWKEELADAGEAASVFSHGVLSRKLSGRRNEIERSLRATQVLTVDEAHNFLNRASNRSRLLYGNVADHVILHTATPINRGARDLLSIVDLLGADNFDDDVLKVVSRLARRRGRATAQAISPGEKEVVRRALQQFVVRRTKDDFNALIDREPDQYVNSLGQLCRYPRHVAKIFERDDPPEDRRLAAAIRETAKRLRGVLNLQSKLRMPGFLRMEGWTDERFLMMRLGGARALAAYQVRSRLRSSKLAMIEHIRGTAFVESEFGLEGAKTSRSGDILSRLREVRGAPPKSELETPLPVWLSDPVEHSLVVDLEIATYEKLLGLAQQMSDYRMESNADYLRGLLARHDRILAFDSHLISLHYLQKLLADDREMQVALATGEMGPAERRRFGQRFELGAEGRGVIGLCSDALAEGLNLQGASAVVHLDLPSVIRLLEQRTGRVDRMDSPHQEIEVHWPDEPKEFSLRSDERLFWRLGEVKDLLGSNVPVPEGFRDYQADEGEYVEIQQLIDAVEEGPGPEGRVSLSDAFERVRGLISGPSSIVPEDVYEQIRQATAKVVSSVAVVPSDRPWVFLAIGAHDRTVPRWAFVNISKADELVLFSSLDQVADEVRARLVTDPQDQTFDVAASDLLSDAIELMEEKHRSLLPRRKQRALEEMSVVLKEYVRQARDSGEQERLALLTRILGLVEPRNGETRIDLEPVAEWWLEVIRPEWYQYLASRLGRQPARLKGLRRGLKKDPIPTARLSGFERLPLTNAPLDRRVVAAIVGVPRS